MGILRGISYAAGTAARAFQALQNRFTFAANGVIFSGRPGEVNGHVQVQKSSAGRIEIGEGFRCNSGKAYNAIGGDTRTVLKTIGRGEIRIGKNVGISNSAIVAASSVTIGDHVMIGGGCRIWDTDFHPLSYEERSASFEAPGETAPVCIREGAFIGAGSILLKGVTIGERAVIGAGSVVTKDVPADEIWAGNPAVFLKKVGD